MELFRVAGTCLALFAAAFTLQGCKEYKASSAYECVDGSSQNEPCKEFKQTGAIEGDGKVIKLELSYVCEDVTAGPYCKKWVQSGTMKEEGGGCFPGTAMIMTRQGPTTMSKLRVGDEILGFDHVTGTAVFTKVRAWLHRDMQAVTSMTSLETAGGLVVASHKHSMWMASGDDRGHTFAGKFQIGDALMAPNGSHHTVKSIKQERVQGLYSPLTGTFNYFAGSGENSMALAHSFAHLQWPRWSEGVVHSMMSVAEFFSRDVHELDYENDRAYAHPVVRPFAFLAGVDLKPQEIAWQANFTMTSSGLVSAAPRFLKGGSSGSNDDGVGAFQFVKLASKPPFIS